MQQTEGGDLAVERPMDVRIPVKSRSAAPTAAPTEQDSAMPAMQPIQPLDEADVQDAHSKLRGKINCRVVPWLFVIVLLIAMCGLTPGSKGLRVPGSKAKPGEEVGAKR